MRTIVPLFLVVITLLSTPAVSQDQFKIDSLLVLLASSEPPQQAQLLNQIGWEYRLAYPDSTLHYCQQAASLAEKEQRFGEVAKAFNLMGLAYVYKGNAAESFRWHQEALAYATDIPDSTQMAHAYNSLGRLFFTQGDVIQSYDYFYKALGIFEKIHNTKGSGYVYQSLGHLYRQQHNLDKALEMFEEARQIRKALQDRRGQFSTLKEIAHLQEKKGNLNDAYHTFQRAEEISEAMNDKISTAEIDLAIAKMSLRRQDYSTAEEYSRRALVAIGLSENEPLLAAIYLTLAKIHYAQSEFRQADVYLQEVVQSAQETGNLQAREESYNYLSRIYEHQQEYERALSFHQQYLSLKDSLYNVDMARTLEQMEGQLALEEKEGEYALLKANEAKNQLLNEQRRAWGVAKSWTIVAISTLLGALFLAYWRIRKKSGLLFNQKQQIEQQHREIREQNEALHQKNMRLAQLDKEKDALISMVAHDLKAPLSRLVGIADLAMLPEIDPNERDTFLQMIKDVSYDGITLTSDLLDSNYLLHDAPVRRTSIQLKPLFDYLLKSFHAQAHNKSIEIYTSVDASVVLYTDEACLTRIINNLLSKRN